VLVGRDDEVWLVDWDDTLLGAPERDLMFVTGGVLAFAPVTADQQAAFFDGYGDVAIDAARLAYAMCVRALEDAVLFAAEAIDPDHHPIEHRLWAVEIITGVLGDDGLVGLALTAARATDG
jgi:spectinomycin phosphotransferase